MAPFLAPHPGITLVLGMEGSGIALCSHLLSRLGWTMCNAPPQNPGIPEDTAKHDEIMVVHRRVLRFLGRDPSDLHPQPLHLGWWTHPDLRAIRDEISRWARKRQASLHPFGVNDPRLCGLLPMWREALAPVGLPVHFIVCLRHPAAVAHALFLRDRLAPEEGVVRWLAYYSDLIDGLGNDDATLLPYEAWSTDPASNLARLSQAKEELDPGDVRVRDLIAGAVDASLAADINQAASSLPPVVRDFQAMLAQCALHGRLDSVARQTARTIAATAAIFRSHCAEQVSGAAAAELEAARAEAQQARAEVLTIREAERRGRWEAAASLAGALAEKERLAAQLASLRGSIAASAPDQANRPQPGRVAFSCVLDEGPMLSAECELWMNCLLRLKGVPPSHVFIHAPVGCGASLLSKAKMLGVNIVPITPPDSRNPHCNKICQLETFMSGTFDYVVLMDCDTAWVGPMALPHAASHPTVMVMAKVVDRANPPESVLAALFEAAGLGDPDWVDVSSPLGAGRRTDRNNCNGGLYILDRAVLPGLHPIWRKWALWCLDREDILGRHVRNADQLGFALALRQLGLSVTPLSMEWNYPTHLPAQDLPDVPPRILHYHKAVTPDHRLLETGVAGPDAAIRKLNVQMAEFDQI